MSTETYALIPQMSLCPYITKFMLFQKKAVHNTKPPNFPPWKMNQGNYGLQVA